MLDNHNSGVSERAWRTRVSGRRDRAQHREKESTPGHTRHNSGDMCVGVWGSVNLIGFERDIDTHTHTHTDLQRGSTLEMSGCLSLHVCVRVSTHLCMRVCSVGYSSIRTQIKCQRACRGSHSLLCLSHRQVFSHSVGDIILLSQDHSLSLSRDHSLSPIRGERKHTNGNRE